MNAELIAVGLIVGVLVGLTGVGGGSIMTPLLIALGIPPLAAVGTDLLYNAPTKLLGAFVHHRQRTVHWKLVGTLCAGGLPTALFGSFFLVWLKAHVAVTVLQAYTRHAVGFALVAASIVIVITPWLLKNQIRDSSEIAWTPRLRTKVVTLGAFVGLIVALTSIGSGSVTLPLLALALPAMGLQTLVGTDIAFAALLIPTAFLGRFSSGDVNVPLAINLLIGSLPGVFVGSKLCGMFKQQYLRPAVAVTLVVVGARLAL